MEDKHSFFMEKALVIAEDMLKRGYLPVGAVLVIDGKVVADNALDEKSGNSLHRLDHAEVMALRRFFNNNNDADLSNASLYVTLEPCLMCYSTSIISGINRMVYAYEDAMGGGTNINHGLLNPFYLEHKMDVAAGVRRKESLELFKRYFENTDTEYAGTLLERYTVGAVV